MNNNQQMPELPQFKPLKLLKTLIFLAMFIIFMGGCFRSGGDFIIKDGVGGISGDTTFKEVMDYSWYYGLFVFPISRMLSFLLSSTSSAIITIFVTTFVIRGVGTLLTLKGTIQMEKMKEITPKIQGITAKYAGKTDVQSRMKMRTEMQALYKKEDINPLGAIGTMFVSMPFFIGLYRAISMTIDIHEAEPILGLWEMAATPWNMVMNGEIWYIVPIIVMAFVQVFSMKLPTKLSLKRSKKSHDAKAIAAQKKMQQTTNIMVIVFVVMGVVLPVSMGVYWVFSGIFTILQVLILHSYFMRKERAKKAI